MTTGLHDVYMFTCYTGAYFHPKIYTRVTCRHVDMQDKTCRHVEQIAYVEPASGNVEPADRNVELSSPSRNIHKHKLKDEPATLPSAASPSLSMEPSAMGLNRGAAAPCKPIEGTRHPGASALLLIPLFGEPKWHPSK
jgi:hypothetical protein